MKKRVGGRVGLGGEVGWLLAIGHGLNSQTGWAAPQAMLPTAQKAGRLGSCAATCAASLRQAGEKNVHTVIHLAAHIAEELLKQLEFGLVHPGQHRQLQAEWQSEWGGG